MVLGLTDADNRSESGLGRRDCLLPHQFVGFIMILPPLRMAQDDPTGTGVAEHGRADVAGMRALRRLVAVLSPQAHARSGQDLANVMQMDGGRTD